MHHQYALVTALDGILDVLYRAVSDQNEYDPCLQYETVKVWDVLGFEQRKVK